MGFDSLVVSKYAQAKSARPKLRRKENLLKADEKRVREQREVPPAEGAERAHRLLPGLQDDKGRGGAAAGAAAGAGALARSVCRDTSC